MLHVTFLRDECKFLANFIKGEIVVSESDDACVLEVHESIHLVEAIACYVSFPELIQFIFLESAETHAK